MSTSFPVSVDSYSVKVDNVNDVLASHINDPQDAIVAIENSLYHGLDNLFINGGFDIWQRTTNDTAVTTTRKYVADRWSFVTGASTLANVQRSTTVRTGARSKYSCELVGAASVTTVNISQRIEAAMSGRYSRTLYFSGYIYNGSGASFTPKIYVSTPSAADDWTTNTVRNGSGSGENLQACTDSAWTLVSWTADVSGYTNIGNGLEIRIEIPSGSMVAGDTNRLAEFMLATLVETLYVQPIYQQVLAQCQRYCYLVDVTTTPISFRASTRWIEVKFFLPVTMRSTQTLTHNISGWTAGAPGTTTVAFLDYITAAYATITGALTIRALAAGKNMIQIEYEAATSFSGTAGNIGEAYFGPSVVAYFDSEL